MSFPYTFKDTVELLGEKIKGVKPDKTLILNILYNVLSKKIETAIDRNESKITYSDYAGFFKLEFDVQITLENKGEDININYEISVNKLVNIILIVVIFLALISFYSVKLFLIFSFLFSTVFYSFYLIYIKGLVRKDIERPLENNIYSFNYKEELTHEQLTWMKDSNRCPACGEYLSIFDADCPDCGLMIKKSRKQLPVDSSKYPNVKIKYYYRKN